MDFWHCVGGMLEVRLTGAAPASLLSAFNRAGVTIYACSAGQDELTVRFLIRRRDFKKADQIACAKGARLDILAEKGIYRHIRNLLKRPVLAGGICLLLILVTFLPTRICFISVDGNTSVPTRLILENAAQCGISFGASRRQVRSEKLKNALLEAIPELQWAGINTSGCKAVISVRERTEAEMTQPAGTVCSIVALRDGVVSKCTVTAGSAVCREGQAVRAGQVLVSGYTDCGISIRAERAQGEVFALTERDLEAVCPVTEIKRQENGRKVKKYSLIIGKKRINLSKDSGIPDASCVKIYTQKYLTLPGGFQLPLAIAIEEVTYCTCEESEVSAEFAESVLLEFSKAYISSQMVAGRILDSDEQFSDHVLSGKYACEEMIGAIQNEEIVLPYVKHD